MSVNLGNLACGPLYVEHRADQVPANAGKPMVIRMVIKDIKNCPGQFLRIADSDQLSSQAVNHYFWQTTNTACYGRHRSKERLDHATAILRSRNVDRYVEIRPQLPDLLRWYIARHQDSAGSNCAGARPKSSLIRLGARKRPAYQDAYDVSSLLNHQT